MQPVLSIKNLVMRYLTAGGDVKALNGVSLEIEPEEVVGIVGESGSGKTTLGLSITKLIPSPPAVYPGGRVDYKGIDLLQIPKGMMRYIRGTEVSMIFQEPLTSLNPVMSIGSQLAEAIRVRESRVSSTSDPETFRLAIQSGQVEKLNESSGAAGQSKEAIVEEGIQALKLVRITDPERVYLRYPHELSGGMRQRVMIAMALSQKPSLLIADEPTSALDVTTQAEILKLIKDLIHEVRTSVLFITHDLATVGHVTDRVAVMYAGEIIEEAPTRELLSNPRHPYTQGLIASFPSGYKRSPAIHPIPGMVPDLRNLPSGCKFHPRCPFAFEPCAERVPAWTTMAEKAEHGVACHLYGGEGKLA